jgi:hypothetical protein
VSGATSPAQESPRSALRQEGVTPAVTEYRQFTTVAQKDLSVMGCREP